MKLPKINNQEENYKIKRNAIIRMRIKLKKITCE
jgi:hypothetical protein